MKKILKIAISAISTTAVLLPIQLHADGTLGSTSTDSIEVTIIREDAVRISAMEDVDFGSHAILSTDSSLLEQFCVFATTGAYKITGSTDTDNPNTFQMDSGTNTLDYQITIGRIDGGSPVAMTPEVAVTGLTGDISSDDCSGSPNTQILLTVLANDFNVVPPGEYLDTLTMFVEPQ